MAAVKSVAHQMASNYHSKFKYESLTESNFDILCNEIDDVLFDINPELAEMLMMIFKSVSTDNKEEWSQALTSCRRFL